MALFPIPSREEIFQTFIADYSGAQPGKNTARGSDPYRLGRVVSGLTWLLASKLLYFLKQALPDTATGWFLDRWGKVFSFPRLPAVGSTGTNALRIVGTIGQAVPFGTELAHADGTLYTVSTTGAVVGGAGYVDVSVAASSTGIATNKNTGDVLTFTGTPPGLTSASLIGPLRGGRDVEKDDPYRVRLLAHIGDPPEGGAIHDYQEWALRVPGVVSAYVWAHRRGQGTIDVAVLGDGTGSARVVSASVLGAVDDLIESLRPGNARDFLMLQTIVETQNVTCTIDTDTDNYGWDWDDAGAGTNVTAQDLGLLTITAPGLPAGATIGSRIQVQGEEATIINRVGDVLSLSFASDYDGNAVTWFSFNPIGHGVRASGDLVRPARDAIIKLFNSLGPQRGKFARTPWIDELKRSKLFAAITDVPGIDDADLTLPVANISPISSIGSSVYFLVPGLIQVLKP